MKTSAAKDIKTKTESVEDSPIRYLNEAVKNYEFSDWVKVSSSQIGMLFSFGKSHPEKKEFIIFLEVLLPFPIAHSFSQIIIKQLSELQEKGYLKLEMIDGGKKNV